MIIIVIIIYLTILREQLIYREGVKYKNNNNSLLI